ncbi:uncharacterized protein EI97DRAFT_422353 [Westerdykella ornata]|uniref:Uncharacterized protein n=1 Tax=Westerdykella ornata TaxID=318751 RepID=A0A6A6JGG5_WESOR|nr:uncharacterized protein EI97DRAFT_422353 [Westerdykella ornata]KAF2274309.1 hypothetical protein EI97DRAFT_422353 [Westerdykella ornata]
MADQQPASFFPPSSIPPPPPLPPSKTSYFSRFVTQPLTTAYGSRPPSAQANHPHGGRPNPLVPRLPDARTGSSQDASHKTGLEISALDINRERTHAILAGKEILKTVRVQGAKIVEETNLRAAILNYADRTTTPARQRDGLGVHDVKWSHGPFGTHIATAAANGKVILYDLNRAGMEMARLHEHTRQVHKLAFNPHQGALLLSASHDATVRLWDLRDFRKEAMTCRSRNQFVGMNGGIRDVQWCPTDALEFAFGTDNGTIQRWDFRHTKGPKQKVTAHDQRTCTSIDWHPDGKHLLSASVDKTVKLWDFSLDGRRQKPAFVLTTPYPVYKARWRPPYWSDEYYEKGVYQCTQIATSYDRDHPAIHVWDLRRPYLPFRELQKFASAPADMLWHSRDTLWTVGREGVFQQNDVHHAAKVVDRRNLQSFALSPTGELAAVVQKRPRQRRAGLDYSSDDTYLGKKRSSSEKTSLRSSADDSLDDSFLSSSLKKSHGRTASSRSTRSFGTTAPSETAPKVMFLTDSLAMHNESLKPNQIAVRGTLPGAFNVQIFAYLAQKYKAIALPDPPTVRAFLDLQHAFDQNAEYAQRAALHRLAETWKIVGRAVTFLARRRAEKHRQHRRTHETTYPASASVASHEANEANNEAAPQIGSDVPLPARDNNTSSLTLTVPPRPVPCATDTSNVPTPVARPVTSPEAASSSSAQQLHPLPDPDEDDGKVQLPPPATGPHSLGPAEASLAQGASNGSLAPDRLTFDASPWYNSPRDLDERRALIGSWRAVPREPLRLEPSSARGMGIDIPHRLDRHDSGESFAMFSASTDSQTAPSASSSFASGRSHNPSMQSIPEDIPLGRPGSSFGKPRPTEQPPLDTANMATSLSISPKNNALGAGYIGPGKPREVFKQGSARAGSSLATDHGSNEHAALEIATLRRNNQLLRHDSSESEVLSSTRDGVLASSPEYNPEMEASGTIVPEFHEKTRAPAQLESSAEDPLLLSDFQAFHVDAEQGAAFTVIGLLENILAFHTRTLSDAQTSSLLVLLLAPLLSQTQSRTDATDILAHFSDVLSSMGMSPAQVQTIVKTQLSHVLTTGINPFQAEAILYTYHDQLHSLSLFNSAASLRRLSYPTYPAVYEQALKDTQLGLLCLSCKSPINNPKDKMRCETCKRAQAPCPICWARFPAFEPATKKKLKAKHRHAHKDTTHRRKRSSLQSDQLRLDTDVEGSEISPSTPENLSGLNTTLWTWCPLCGHGGHTHCLSTWFANGNLSDGACATEGCLCDCVSGRRRHDKLDEMIARKAEKERSKMVRKGDDWKIGESKAVSAVRGTLPVGDGSTTESVDSPRNQVSTTTGASSAGTQLGKKEDARRVRVVGPEDSR